MIIPTEAQLNQLLGAIEPADEFAPRDRALLIFLANTGLRVSEMVSLTVGTVYRNRFLFHEITVVGKGHKRVVPLNDAARKALAVILKFNYYQGFPVTPESPLLFNRWRVPMTARGIQLIVQKLRERANLNVPCTPHSLRHRFATSMLQRGVTVPVVQELLGHRWSATTDRYSHVSPEQKRRSVDKL